MKKTFSITTIVLMLVLIFVFAFVGCKNPAETQNGNKNNPVNSNSELLTFSAVSVGNMMGMFGSGAAMMATEIQPEVSNNETNVVTDPNLNKINYYMGVVDGLLGTDIKSETVELTENDYEGKYAKKTTITITSGINVKEYVMVFNEVLKDQIPEEDEDEEDKNNQEVEEEFTIEGLLIIDNVTYIFNGERSNETEVEEGSTETEAEFEFTAYVAKDNQGVLEKDLNNYIDFKQEIENEEGEVEQEFKYQIFKNGKMTKTFEVEIEKDPVDNELEIELIDGSLHLNYESEVEKDGKEIISIRATENGNVNIYKAEVTYDEAGNKVYNYKEANGEDLGSLPEEDFEDDEEDEESTEEK